jgi:hypothetical protein
VWPLLMSRLRREAETGIYEARKIKSACTVLGSRNSCFFADPTVKIIICRLFFFALEVSCLCYSLSEAQRPYDCLVA